MYTAVILEDEIPALEVLELLVDRHESFTVAATFTNPEEALEQLPGLQPDVIFLDVEMPQMNGLEIARRFRQMSERSHIVFTTGHTHYALKAFDVQALDYIVKPVTPKAIARVYDRLTRQQLSRNAPEQFSSAAAQLPAPARVPTVTGFGRLEVRSADRELIRFPTRKAEELFAYLLCHPNLEADKWKLAELLWPDIDGERALRSLHTAIYRVKRVMEAAGLPMRIMKTAEGYTLDTDAFVYDILHYQHAGQLLTEENPELEQLDLLFGLYKGPLFHGKSYVWKISLEESYRLVYEKLTLRLIGGAVSSGAYEAAEERFYACLLADPLNEELYRQLLALFPAKEQSQRIQRLYTRLLEDHSRQ
ncbi:response regulator [Paenibacillus sp. FSL K6-1096]|uniref:response regulator n=1 Tax=Paenibacillus sp. FSL K6-1096 TaxID=2921460 RepID=UPI0030ECA91E